MLTRVNAMEKQKGGAQISLFGEFIEEQAIEIQYPNIPEFETMEKLSKEKSVLGVYVSGHPFEKFLPYFKDRTFNCSMLNDYEEDEETGRKTYHNIQDGQQVTMGGMISTYKKLKTRSGSFMAFVTVEDLYGSVECVCFPKVYERIRGFLDSDRVVSLSGKMSVEDEKVPAIIVDKMWEFTPEEAQQKPATATENGAPAPVSEEKSNAEKRLWLNITGMEDEDVEELLDTLAFYPGETVVCFVKDGKKMLCSHKINPNKALFAELASFLPENCIKFL